ncbi:biopolymer transporter ExbD [Rhodoferax sp.]|uniref:ExbD/TolR family protein n=1 Tax=Rhodoferax sp. TaxID=50421 RepID=UPI00262E60A1|nr:biopolymer transporter ExbD [Rhodoferax sp.]MDD2924057.1 biopolymer transporter ExbD [Rhodoferax sp.]
MGMHVGNTNSSGEPEVMMEINTTPLIDVMLVLLVMLIITIPIQLHSVNLEMPVGAPPSQQIKPEEIQIDIDAQSVVYWQGLPMAAAELDDKMKAVATLSPQPEVHIRPNKDSQYAVFANVLSSSKRLGLNKIAVIGAEQFTQ